MNDIVQNAYRIVLEDIINNGANLMIGKYDAKNGNKEFMYGILTVMKWLAYKTNDDIGDMFFDLFTMNMIQSEREVKIK